jgi:polar amino acid transport system permease protein
MYGLPLYGFRMSREMVAYVTFTINYAAYFTEIIRGGIESVDQGQYDAAKTLGLKRTQTFIRIVLPQSLKRVLPSITNEGITLVKDTALVAAIALGDVLRNTKEVVSRTMNPSAYIITALIYLTLSYVIVKAFKKIEKRYAYYR